MHIFNIVCGHHTRVEHFLKASVVLSVFTKASSHVSSRTEASGPISKVHGVCSNEDVTFASEG